MITGVFGGTAIRANDRAGNTWRTECRGGQTAIRWERKY